MRGVCCSAVRPSRLAFGSHLRMRTSLPSASPLILRRSCLSEPRRTHHVPVTGKPTITSVAYSSAVRPSRLAFGSHLRMRMFSPRTNSPGPSRLTFGSHLRMRMLSIRTNSPHPSRLAFGSHLRMRTFSPRKNPLILRRSLLSEPRRTHHLHAPHRNPRP